MKTITLHNNRDEKIIDLHDFKDGSYLVSIVINGKVRETRKITVLN